MRPCRGCLGLTGLSVARRCPTGNGAPDRIGARGGRADRRRGGRLSSRGLGPLRLVGRKGLRCGCRGGWKAGAEPWGISPIPSSGDAGLQERDGLKAAV